MSRTDSPALLSTRHVFAALALSAFIAGCSSAADQSAAASSGTNDRVAPRIGLVLGSHLQAIPHVGGGSTGDTDTPPTDTGNPDTTDTATGSGTVTDTGTGSGTVTDTGTGSGTVTDTGTAVTDTGTTSTPAATLYVAPGSYAAVQADAWRTSDPAAAALMDGMASKPLALWLGDWTKSVTSTVNDAVTVAGSQVRVFVVYDIPHRDCGAWSSGGAADAATYNAFVAEVAAGLGGRHAMVVLEPDGLAAITCLSSAQLTEREGLMSAAVDTLTAAGASVYLDAGDSDWVSAADMSARLTLAGVGHAAGFALNVSHTETTTNSIGYAEELRAILGTDAHYVVDSDRNGAGPDSTHSWCNPLGRALGEAPTLSTGVTGMDGVLWIKGPGESDGSCNGGPVAGAWWASYALSLAETPATAT